MLNIMWSYRFCRSVLLLALLTLIADTIRAVELICENGFRPGTHYYHLGNGGYAYHASDDSPQAIYFKCVFYERGCRGRAIYSYNGRFTESQPHDHAADAHFVGERHFRENLLNEIGERRFVNYQEILDQYRSDQRYARNVRCKMTLARLRGSMREKHMGRYPNIPHTMRKLTQVLLQNNFVSKTIDGEENLYAGSCTDAEGHHHIAFFSPRMLQFMPSLKIIQGDGTFKSRPALPASRQVFVLVTTWDNVVVPLGWFLMESKSRAAYIAIFNLLRHLCPNLDPDVIVSDWEWAQQDAWQNIFPRAQIQGCLWHLGKAFVKKARSLGILRYRKILPSLVTYLRKATAISLLPRQYFMVGLRCLKDAAFEEDIRVSFLLEPFFDYVEERWIRNAVRRRWMTLFESEYRTNNSCETHNRMLRNKVGAYRPNVYLFIQALATLENNASLDCQLKFGGNNPRRTRRWKSVYTDRQLKRLSFNLRNQIFHNMNEVVLNFLTRASELFHGAFDDHVRRAFGRHPANDDED
ncbi:Cytoplasmic protein NCK2 [Frankliniella fusca]|uniref:Cytoplasmic protein NCK2 n=1 Tax=Frankliniella fusca TaxID=407009 RepID=A0AAE1L690_9NEOP|nr:Cytoplasmic protein NCK2 [Frankliniella fusca]